MTMEETIKWINELYHKSQTPQGLTAGEKEEQAKLRGAYIESVRKNLRGQLNNIDILQPDGTIENLGEKYGNKKRTTH